MEDRPEFRVVVVVPDIWAYALELVGCRGSCSEEIANETHLIKLERQDLRPRVPNFREVRLRFKSAYFLLSCTQSSFVLDLAPVTHENAIWYNERALLPSSLLPR